MSARPTKNFNQLREKANEFLISKDYSNNLKDIINYLKECISKKESTTRGILALELIFMELLKKREMCIIITPLKPKDNSPETEYKEWLRSFYEESWHLILKCLNSERHNDSIQALVSSMKLLSNEGKYPIDSKADSNDDYYFPVNRFHSILVHLLNNEKSNEHLFQRFKEYSEYLDVIFYAWKLIPSLTIKGSTPSEYYARNYLSLIHVLPVTEDIFTTKKLFCSLQEDSNKKFDYFKIKKRINESWNCVMLWKMNESVHKEVLIILIDRFIQHLDKPVLLTDFLMDSLDIGGPVSLLALQGVFTLVQKHNITYPNIYEKLYSMFEPEIFHTKYKARLFYLADIFLCSTHLPETLVAAFTKRLARLSLIAPPQDIVIILYFIGNLLVRHPGLKRLIYHPSGGSEVSRDPYIMDERDPIKSNALESCLWEIVSLQSHAIPSVATAAKFISKPLPEVEFDLSTVLDVKEDTLGI